MAIYVIIVSIFVIVTVRINIFPLKYLVAIFSILLLISACVISLLIKEYLIIKSSKNNKFSKKAIISVFIAIVFSVLVSIGSIYMAGTLNFLEDISKNIQVQDYYVVVKKDSSFEDLKELKGKTVGVMALENEHYKKAQYELKEKIAVDLA